MFGLL
ncbi:hypothetical protein LINPERHAP1_LOCUS23271 [Linum perenne]